MGDRLLRFEAKGTLGTALLMLLIVATVVANAVILIPAALEGREVDGEIIAPWFMVTACGIMLALVVRSRVRSMGVFAVDGAARMITRVDGGEKWPFEEVERVSLAIDPMQRRGAPIPSHWIVVHLPARRRLLLCRGHPADLAPVVERLAALGLPRA